MLTVPGWPCVLGIGAGVLAEVVLEAVVLKAIKDNDPSAVALGYEIDRIKLAGRVGVLRAVLPGFEMLTDVPGACPAIVILMTLAAARTWLVVALDNQPGDVGNAGRGAPCRMVRNAR